MFDQRVIGHQPKTKNHQPTTTSQQPQPPPEPTPTSHPLIPVKLQFALLSWHPDACSSPALLFPGRCMRQLNRLLRYAAPYWWQVLSSVVLMAAVGFLDAFRLLLIGPILDRVLNPNASTHDMKLLPIPGTHESIHLEQFVPSSFQNPWAVVAFALVASTLLKGIFDYAGTYLVSYAGFGMITDLRDHMYNAILRRSAAFFQKHTTGTLLSTLINDLERVQFSLSSVLGE